MANPVAVLVLLGFLWRSNTRQAYTVLAGLLVAISVVLSLGVIVTLHDDELSVIYLTCSVVMIVASIVTALTYRWWHGIRRGWTGSVPTGG
jgi:hypothetical protein